MSPQEVHPVTEVLKEGEAFLVSLPTGEIPRGNQGGLGLYYQDTRFLNCLEFFLDGTKPVLLSSTTRDGHFSQFELTNAELQASNGKVVTVNTIHIRTLRALKQSLYQRMRLINFGLCTVTVRLSYVLSADFADIFEVRGLHRKERGTHDPVKIHDCGFTFSYRGRDRKRRLTNVFFSPAPGNLWVDADGHGHVEFALNLEPQKKYYIYLKVTPAIEPVLDVDARSGWERSSGSSNENSLQTDDIEKRFIGITKELSGRCEKWCQDCTRFESDNPLFNQMVKWAIMDLRSLVTDYGEAGRIIDAGIPWFAAPFGRDSLITSWQTLVVNPAFAKDTLRFLARYQGRKSDRWSEEKPGKILHELRRGEMAGAGEIPHTPYYGSVDSTLWFVILLGELFRWTEDHEFLAEMADPLYGCLKWYREYGDLDGDGYVEYIRESESGLINQGWKDSWDGVIDRDGSIPESPIALVEVQAYLYLALQYASEMLLALGDHAESLRVQKEAARLQEKFLRDFWMEDEGFLAFCLDKEKRPVRTVVSNGGQCLFSGILPTFFAEKVARRLFMSDLYSGWGIRTMSSLEKPYNPMSYHNGSVWPHDNAIVAKGLRLYEQLPQLEKLTNDIFDAAFSFPYYRLPELFCGFARREKGGPVPYPTSCNPQAWAVSSIFLFIKVMIGLSCRKGEIHVSKPFLPLWMNELYIENLSVGTGRVDLEFARSRGKIYCNVLKSDGDLKVIIKP